MHLRHQCSGAGSTLRNKLNLLSSIPWHSNCTFKQLNKMSLEYLYDKLEGLEEMLSNLVIFSEDYERMK